eukprot:70053-Karenia_brevis.AAC.1
MQRSGCWAVQRTLMAISGVQLAILINELQGHALFVSKSPYGNSVLQTAIEYAMRSDILFVLMEIRGSAMQVACNKYGSRIIQPLTENALFDPHVE